MKSKKVHWIWILSIVAAIAVIALQGYWLYNQYLYNLAKTADKLEAQTISAWKDYKALQKQRLKNKKEKLKSYNSNFDQKNIYISDADGSTNITDWNIIISTTQKQPVNNAKEKGKKREKLSDKELQAITENLQEALTLPQKDTINPAAISSQQLDSLTKKPWRITTNRHDSVIVKELNFSTKENANAVYEAVDMYLTYQNIPFDKNELDSLISAKIGHITFAADTLTISSDSVLWQPQTEKKLQLKHPKILVSIPYNILERKVETISIPIIPNQILQAMFWQILITFLLLLLLIFALGVQVKTISRQMRINQLRQNFVHTTIHELKRPIQTLKSIVSFLQNTPSGQPKNSDVLNDARKETDNLTAYLQKLREVNAGENISDSMHLSYFNFTELARENIEALKKNTRKPIHIESRFPTENVMISADKMALNNVITNLLENAVKYSGATADIVFRAETTHHKLRFSIADKGFGIDAAEQNHVWEPFYRSKNEKIAALPGMGLGLSYVKMIVEAHRGGIHIASKVHQGTTVTIEIPQ